MVNVLLFMFNLLTFEQQSDFVTGKAGEPEPDFIELVLPNKVNVLKDVFMKTKCFNDNHLTPLLSRINKEEKYVY